MNIKWIGSYFLSTVGDPAIRNAKSPRPTACRRYPPQFAGAPTRYPAIPPALVARAGILEVGSGEPKRPPCATRSAVEDVAHRGRRKRRPIVPRDPADRGTSLRDHSRAKYRRRGEVLLGRLDRLHRRRHAPSRSQRP